MDLNAPELREAVINRAAELLIDSAEQHDMIETINCKVDAAVAKTYREAAQSAVDAAVRKVFEDGFNRSFTPVDGFGQQQGEPRSIKTILEALSKDYWTTPVGKDGKPADRYSSTKMTRAEWLMAQICVEDFSKEVRQMAVDATAQFKDGLRAALRGEVDKMLGKVLRVKSSDDKAEGRRNG
ncbi:MAG: hypothetical protein AAF968_06400 [Pseudomonadota bacterium]